MPSQETPPNSPVGTSDLSDSEENSFNENDVSEVIEDENELESFVDSESDEILETQESIPERDDSVLVFSEHKDTVLSCEFHPKLNNLALTGGIDDNAFIWDVTNGNKLFLCEGHEESVEIVSFNHDGTYFGTGDLNGIIKVWRTRDFSLITTLDLDDELSWMQWHHGTNVLIASSQAGIIYMYKIPSGERKMILPSYGQNCMAGKILSDGKRLVAGYKDGNLRIVDLKQTTVLNEIKPFDEIGGITCIDIHKHNGLIICGSESGAVMLVNSNSGKIASVLQGTLSPDGTHYIETVVFCKDPSYQVAASGSLDGSLIIWDIIKQTLRHKYNFLSCINGLVWHPNQPVLFICNFEGVARAYDAKAGVILKEFLGHHKSCLSMSLSSDGSLLMTTSEDKTVRLFYVGNIL